MHVQQETIGVTIRLDDMEANALGEALRTILQSESMVDELTVFEVAVIQGICTDL